MRNRFISLFALMLLLIASSVAPAQAFLPSSNVYAWATPTGSGQLGSYLITASPRLGNYSIDWTVTGTAPSACTFRVEGSSDAVAWYGLDTTAPASTSCVTGNLESIAYKPVQYLRVTLATYTAGDATTKVIFHYTGGRS